MLDAMETFPSQLGARMRAARKAYLAEAFARHREDAQRELALREPDELFEPLALYDPEDEINF